MLLTTLSRIAAALRAYFGMPEKRQAESRLYVGIDVARPGATCHWQINEGGQPTLLDQHVQHLGLPA